MTPQAVVNNKYKPRVIKATPAGSIYHSKKKSKKSSSYENLEMNNLIESGI